AARGFFDIGWGYAKNVRNMSNSEKIGKVPAIAMNLSFSAELLLKYLCYTERRDIPYTHELYKLFNFLSVERRENIKSEFHALVRDNTASKKLEIFMLSNHKEGEKLPT